MLYHKTRERGKHKSQWSTLDIFNQSDFVIFVSGLCTISVSAEEGVLVAHPVHAVAVEARDARVAVRADDAATAAAHKVGAAAAATGGEPSRGHTAAARSGEYAGAKGGKLPAAVRGAVVSPESGKDGKEVVEPGGEGEGLEEAVGELWPSLSQHNLYNGTNIIGW